MTSADRCFSECCRLSSEEELVGFLEGADMTRSLFCGRISRVNTANGTTDKKRTMDDRMILHPRFDGISE